MTEMAGQELRQKFINFFKNRPDLPHQEIPSASLVPSEEEQLEGKEKVLFTSAGMQPLIPYLTGKKEPPSKRLVDVQKCLRTDDIEEVGDEFHHTFFEMLGNWSIGDYWKEGAIKLSFEFLTQELAIPIEKLAVTVFAGDEDAPKDEESAGIWKSLGIPDDRIFYFGKSHNWWPTARGEQDSEEYKNPSGPCGPDTEMFYWTGEGEPEGKPNEDSRWVEIWNDVFMQFNRKEDGTLEDLPQKNVDTGMGLERTLAVLNGKKSDYETDLFQLIVKTILGNYGGIIDQDKIYESEDYPLKPINAPIYEQNDEEELRRKVIENVRIIADHIKASVFLVLDEVEPSNQREGYVLRKLLRRTIVLLSRLTEIEIKEFLESYKLGSIVKAVVNTYQDAYPELSNSQDRVNKIIEQEWDKFKENIHTAYPAIIEIMNRKDEVVSGDDAFLLFASHGILPQVLEEVANKFGKKIDWDKFKLRMKEHQRISKVEQGIFKGGLAGHSETEIKYHTATHLLHQALRDELGPEVFQKGSNITSERLRFDFSFDRKMTDEEIQQVEDIVNGKILENLKLGKKIVSPDEAKKMGALGLFDAKYGSEVSVYGIGPGYMLDPNAKDQRERDYYSLEICGGPHVETTGVIGKIQITKEEAVSAGIRRIRAQII